MSTETDWFEQHRIDPHADTHRCEKSSASMLLDALLVAIMGWALLMCAISTAFRAWFKR